MPRKKTSHEIKYLEEEGQVRFHLRRNVYLNVPTAVMEAGGYDPLLQSKPPKKSLALDWVYGYRGHDTRNNMCVLGSGEVAYFTAGVVVMYELEKHTQRYYTQHSDDIKSIALHPDGVIVATGQVKGRDDELNAAHIRVWNSTTLETLHVFGAGVLERGVSCLAFSHLDGGTMLAVTDAALEPRLSVWAWQDEDKMVDIRCSGDPIIAVNFSREEDVTRVITTGKNSIVFWTLESDGSEGHVLKRRTGVFGDYDKPKYVTAVTFNSAGETITGDSNGNIFLWDKGGSSIYRALMSAHDGSIFYITATKDGGFLSSGKDRQIKQWDSNFNSTGVNVELSENLGGARTVVEVGERLVVGTIRNIIAEGNLKDGFTGISQGSLDELWGLAEHPSEHKFVTGCLDGVLIERDLDARDATWTMEMGAGVQSGGYSPGGEVVVAGLVDGAWKVVAGEEVVAEGKDGEEPIQVVKFSPDGSMLALASRDNNIYVYDVYDEFKAYEKRGVCTGHSSFIRSLDWSADGAFMQTNSGDYELLYWNSSDCSQEVNSTDMKDTEWATHSCLLYFGNLGVWPEGVDGTDLNAVSWSHAGDLSVTADDFGKVKLFKAPVHFVYGAHKVSRGHSSHVTGAVFSHDDAFVISIGGADATTMQWKVLPGQGEEQEQEEEE